ncbi:hypothetical protein MINTM021_10240 [Mycobacterium paraintracellulare]|nr:hypothetical protein MINTM021_10240 [Mycobacterium paraintracellulare]
MQGVPDSVDGNACSVSLGHRSFWFGGAFGHLELPVLHLAQRSTERLAGTQAMQGQVESSLGDAYAGSTNANATTRQTRQRNRKTTTGGPNKFL